MPLTDLQQAGLILRTPLKGKRMLLGGGLVAIGLAIFTTFHMNGTAGSWDALLAVFLLVGAGFGFAGLDYVVRIEPGTPAILCSGWQFFHLAIWPQRRSKLEGVDRVVIGYRRLPVTSPHRRGPTLRPVYPVWLLSGSSFLNYLLGWPPEYLERVSTGFFIRSRPPNFAVFRAWACYVAAQAALCLNVPLFDEKTDTLYLPADIPQEWLQREKLSFDSYHQGD